MILTTQALITSNQIFDCQNKGQLHVTRGSVHNISKIHRIHMINVDIVGRRFLTPSFL